MESIDLREKRVLVLGGSGSLGSLIAAELKRRGSIPVLAGRHAARLHAAATDLGADTPSILFDLREPGHARHVVEMTIEMVGGIDGVVNAAGVVAFGNLSDTDPEAIVEVIATDLLGPMLVMQAAAAHIDNGFFANITGVVAEQPMAGMAVYSAAKAGLSAASAALGRELRRSGIHVLDARPPHTETGLADRPVAGTAPRMPQGLDPSAVARAIVDAIQAGKRELAASDFTAG